MNRLGEYLKQWRTTAGLNQEAVAAKVGVGQSTNSAAERGTLSAQLLVRLVNVYAPPTHEVGEAMMLPREEPAEPSAEAAGA